MQRQNKFGKLARKKKQNQKKLKDWPSSYGTFKRHLVPILGKDGSSPNHYVPMALNEFFINQALAWDLYFTAALCYV